MTASPGTLTDSIAPEHCNRIREEIDVVRIASKTDTVAVDHARRSDRVQIVDVYIPERALKVEDGTLARLSNGSVGASSLFFTLAFAATCS